MRENTLTTQSFYFSVMKRTLFLAYILAALLACSAAPQAYGYDEEISDDTYALTDWEYPDEDFVPNVLNVGKDADNESDDYWGDVVMDHPIYVWSTNGIITNGSVSCPVYIFAGSKLTLAAAQDGLRAADLVYWSGDDIDLSEVDEDEKVMIYMYNNSTLDYRDKDVRLGLLTTYSDNTVYIQCGNLVTEEFGSTWDFTINAEIQLKDSNSHLWIARYTKSVTLNCEQNMNLYVGDDRAYSYDGQYYGISGDGCKLNNCTLNLPDNKTSNIYGHLGGTSTITLGNGTTVQGWNETIGSIQHFSWLTNNIVVRENCSATMQTGYYGGTITMRIGSSLKFDMDLIPAGVDPDHLEGGAKVSMFVNNTLDLAGRATALDVTVIGTGNTVKNGTITSKMTLEDYAVLNWEGGDLNLSDEASLGRDAVLNLNGRSINNVTLTAFGAIVCNGTVTGNFTLADNVAYSWSQLGGYGLTLRGGVTLGDNTLLNLDEIKNTWTTAIALKGSATIGNGKLDGAFSVGEGKTLTLCDDFTGTGTITLNGSATLDLVTHRLVRDVTLNGNATITGGVIDGTVTVNSGKKLTLGGKLTGTGAVSLNGGAELALGNHELAKAVTVGGSTTISGGTIDNCVSLQGSAILSLKNATLGDNSSFTLGNGSLLDLGGAQGAAWLNPSDDATATVENGCIGLTGGEDNVKVYTLSFTQAGTISRIVGNGFRANLGENVSIATRNNVRFIESEVEQGDNQPPLNIDVTAQGKFALGKPPAEIGDSTPVINGNVKITYTGTGVQDSLDKDVDIYCTLIGSLTVVAKNGRVNAGGIGPRKPLEELSDNDLTSTGSVEAKQVYLTGFIGQSLTLKAANNGEDDAIQVTGNAIAAKSLLFKAVEDNVYGNIVFNSALSAKSITLEGKNIEGKSITLEGKNIEGKGEAGYVEFENCDITATGAISIGQEFRGLAGQADSVLTAEAEGKVTLKVVGTAAAPIARASITSNANDVEMSSFTGAFLKLKASAAGAVTISESVVTTAGTSPSQTLDKYAVELEGGSIDIYSLSALNGNSFVHSTVGNITIGGALSALDTTKLDSAADITVSGNVLGGNLSATAGQSISLQNIGTLDNSVKDAVLTATNGTITATSFNGATLKASAKGAVTFNGNVAASGDDKRISSPTGTILVYSVELEGGSVGISGSLANNAGTALIKSTAGDISVGDALTARYAYMTSIGGNITLSGNIRTDFDCILNSAANITVSGDVLGGNLTATAAQSISLQAITRDAKAAILKAGSDNVLGNIMVSSFTGSVLIAHATGAVTINECVAASASGINLTGASVSAGGSLTASKGNCFITSNGGGISIGGNLSAMESSTLESAGNITLGTLNDKGEIIDGGNVTGGDLRATATGSIELGAFTADDLRATAGGSIKVGSIGTAEQPAGTVTLTATNGGITAGDVNAGTLTATAGSSIKLGAFATGNLTATAGGSIELGAFTAGNLTATAGTSITLANIGTAEQLAGNVALEAQGDITATSSVNADTLTVSAAGNVAMKDVTVGQEGASIVSTDGTAIAVNLETFTGEKAQIKAENGAIQIGAVKGANNTLQAASTLQVKTAVSGSGHTFLAGTSVTFDDNPSTNGLSNATVRAPEVKWTRGTTLLNVTVTGAKETDVTKVTVGGALTMQNSRVQGDVTINGMNAKVTVAGSTVTGTVGGTSAIKLELNGGEIGGVGELASLTSAGTSSITGLTDNLVIPTLTLNGGSLKLIQQTQPESLGLAAVSTLEVTKCTQLYSNLDLNYESTLNFTLSAENTTIPLLAIKDNGQLTMEPSFYSSLTINLAGDASVEGGKAYALISVGGGETPDFWNYTILTVNGLGAKEDNLSWNNGTLYYQNGTALETAVWTPGENHLWNTVDQNWTQDGHRYRYMDGVDVVFNDKGKGGDVQLEGELAPKDVLVEGTCNYTFKGTGKITGATALTKNGSGTLTIENANTYSGGTTINAGTLVVANAQALGTGTVTLAGGTVQIANGAKSFNLVVTGTDTHLAGSETNAFTGSLTLAEGSKLSADGGALSSANVMEKIVMKSGSSLAMTQIDGLNNRIWINRVSEFTVEGEATLADVYLYLDPDGEYTLGAMTGDNVNSLQNLRGTGITAYCLDGSTLDLNQQTNHLNIIAWEQNSSNDSRVKNGTLNTKLDIYRNSSLHLENTTLGRNATFRMGEGAYLNMGGYDVRAQMSMFAFDVDGSGATIDNGTIIVDQAETNRLVTLCRGFLKGSFSVSLVEGTVLDLDMNTLYIASTGLEGTSASIGNGTINGRINVGSGQTLSLLNHLNGTGTVYLDDNASLNLGGHNLGKDVDMTGSTSIDRGCLTETVTLCGGTLDLGGALFVYGMNLQSDHAVALNGQTLQVDHMQLSGHTLTLDGAGTLDALEAVTGGAIAKTGEGRLNIQGPVQLTGLDVQGGDTTVTGTGETKISIGSLKAAAGSTIELVHTNATAANEALAYKGNLVIGNGSTVTAGGNDGWAYGTDNSLTIQKGGKLDLGNYRWSFAPGNKVTLAGGEIAGSGSDAYGVIDFCGGDNVVAVTEDSTLSARMRVRGSVAFDVGEGKELSFTGGIVSSGAYDDDKGTVYKTGAGTMVMSGANAMPHGTVNVQAGTLKVTGNYNPLGAAAVNVSGGATLELGGTLAPTGVVNLKGGTLKISEGSKNFALTVTGTDNRMEGDYFNAFTGAVTLEENSRLVSAGSMASWDGPREIVMKDGSTLEMDTHMDIWINDITNLTVEGEATMVNAFLRINPETNGGVYTLDNGVENLKGEGVTSYCLDGSTFILNGNTTNLGIIVWNSQPNKDNTVIGGLVDTKVDIHQASRLILSDVEIGDNATFFMGDGAYLDMGGGFTKKARLSAFSFTGASVTIDNGKLLVADGESVQLRTELLGNATISLGKEANLDLNGYTLAGSRIELADASATVSGGQFSGDVTVKSGKTLHLGVEQSITGAVKLNSSSKLGLGSDCSVEGAISGSGTIMKEGIGTSALSGDSLKSFTGSLEVQGGILNLMNAASVNVQDVTIQNGTLGVYKVDTANEANEANEATLTIKGSKTLTAGPDAALNANLVMEGGSTLDVRNTNGAGLLMGSTVTLSTGMTLEGYGSDWATWKDGTKYVLFTGVDGLDIGGGMMTGTLDYTQWVDAKEYFTNIEESNRYFLCYGGAPDQNAKGILTAVNDGSNVGMVYIMTMPEPTTSTLSLLALAALAARRRKD